MAIRPDWTIGKLTLSAGSKNFTTTGAAMQSAAVQAGDELITASGAMLIIATITSDNAGTLYEPCPASVAGIEQPLRIRFQPDGSRYSAAARDMIEQLGNGNLYALSGLQAGVGQVPYFTAPGVMGLLDLASLGGGGASGGWDALVGTLAGRDAFDGEAVGFRVLVADNGNGQAVIYEKIATGWSVPVPFTGPKGSDGAPNTLTVGTVSEGTQAHVSITGTAPNQIVNFVLRRGEPGPMGDVTPAALAAKDAAETAAVQTALDRAAANQSAVNAGASEAGVAADALSAANSATSANNSKIDAQAAAIISDERATVSTGAASTATTQTGLATAAATQAAGDKIATAADRVATGQDRTVVAADKAAAQTASTAAVTASDRAREWANAPEGQVLEAGEYSAYHWSKVAETAAGGGVQSVNGKAGADITLTAADVGAAPVSIVSDVTANTSARHAHSNKATLDAITAAFLVADRDKLDIIPANATANTGTVTSVAMSVPAGFSVSGAITTSGTFVMTFAAGYQGFTTVQSDKLATIAEGAQVNPNMALYQAVSQKDAANGYAGLDSAGKLSAAQLPAIAITDTFVVATQAAMLALAVQVGDIAVRTDVNKTFIVQAEPATTLANWVELRTPTDAVQSVIGLTGPITQTELRTALGLGTAAYAATGDFATAASGVLANTAVQPAVMTAADNLRVPIAGATGLGGFSATPVAASASITLSSATGNYRPITNNGAITITAPTGTEGDSYFLVITNGASAGAVTFSGFTVEGDTILTTVGKKYFVSIARIGSDAVAFVKGKP